MKYLSIPMLLMLTALATSLLSEWSMVIDFAIMNMSILTMQFSILLEKENLAFTFTVFYIFLMIYMYSFSYLSSEVYLKRFLLILSLFVGSMCILILSSNLFSTLIGWDGLGVTSLFLILFYYSKSAQKAATLTFLMNRIGDCFFILALTQVILTSETHLAYSCSSFSISISLLLVLTSITKSAQIPFSTWLPAAMEAPTPVSALVHSSTLVTAGIYLLYRYKILWVGSKDVSDLLLILSLSTCFMAALSALVESDLKKLIALSTLSQLGFIMFSFSLGLLTQGFVHMLMHAYFKALLFMCAGLTIHSFKGSQTITIMMLSKKQNPLMMMIMGCSLMSMSGMPFLSGFFSKDLIIDSIKEEFSYPLLIILTLVASFVCTIMYSVRALWYLMNSSSSWHSMSDDDLNMVKPMLPLAVMASLGGSMTSWLMVDQSFYINSSKVMIMMLLWVSSVGYWHWSQVGMSPFLENKWNLSTFNSMLSDLFFSSAARYKNSSDLLGIPEIIIMYLKVSLDFSSKILASSMIHYSGSMEFLLFLTVIMLMVL